MREFVPPKASWALSILVLGILGFFAAGIAVGLVTRPFRAFGILWSDSAAGGVFWLLFLAAAGLLLIKPRRVRVEAGEIRIETLLQTSVFAAGETLVDEFNFGIERTPKPTIGLRRSGHRLRSIISVTSFPPAQRNELEAALEDFRSRSLWAPG